MSIQIPGEMKRKLNDMAQRHDRSEAAEAREAIRQYIQDFQLRVASGNEYRIMDLPDRLRPVEPEREGPSEEGDGTLHYRKKRQHSTSQFITPGSTSQRFAPTFAEPD